MVKHGLGYLERIVARNGTGFAVGRALTYADIALFHTVERLTDNRLASGLAGCPNLAALAERVRTQPRIAAYVGGPKRWPLQLLPT